MIGPPALPSQPPPPREDAVQPMHVLAACLWVIGATIAFYLIAGVVHGARGDTVPNQTAMIACQGCAYLLALFAILRFYGPDKSIAAFVGLRGTHAGFYLLAIVLGLSATFWTDWIYDQLARRHPREEPFRLVELFFEASPQARAAMAVAIAGAGPMIEELLFRGAIFAPMARAHRMTTVIAASAATFALVHQDWNALPPVFLLGLVLGYLRAASGSIVPSMLMHVVFNGVGVASFYALDKPPPPSAPDDLPRWLPPASFGVFALTLAATALLARHSQHAARARQASLDC